MSIRTVEIQSRIVGQTDAGLTPVLLNFVEERVTVGELIKRTVEEQVRCLLVDRRMQASEVQSVLQRQYLTNEEVAAQAARGKVGLPARAKNDVPKVDTVAEVSKALHAFKSGRFYIFSGGRQIEALDEVLNFEQQTKITFLRLVPLAGG